MRHQRLSLASFFFFFGAPFGAVAGMVPLLVVAVVTVSFLEDAVPDRREGTRESVDLAERARERREDVSLSESLSRGAGAGAREEVELELEPFLALPLGGREDSPDALLVMGSDVEDCVLGESNSGVELSVLVSNSGLRCGVEICDGMGVGVLEYTPEVWKVFGVEKGCTTFCLRKLS